MPGRNSGNLVSGMRRRPQGTPRPGKGQPRAPEPDRKALDAMAAAAQRARARLGGPRDAPPQEPALPAEHQASTDAPPEGVLEAPVRPAESSRALNAMAAAAERARARQRGPGDEPADEAARAAGVPPVDPRAGEPARAADVAPVVADVADEQPTEDRSRRPTGRRRASSGQGTRRVGGFKESRADDDEIGPRRLVSRATASSAGRTSRRQDRHTSATPPLMRRPATGRGERSASGPPPPPAPPGRGPTTAGRWSDRLGASKWVLALALAFVLAAAGVAAALALGSGPGRAAGTSTRTSSATLGSTTPGHSGGATTTAPPATTPTTPTPTTTPPSTTPTTTAPPASASTPGKGGGSAPKLTSVSPGSGRSGQALTISGSGFFSTDGQITAYFGRQPAPTRCATETTCSVTVPDLGTSAASVTITVVTSGGTSNGLAFSYH